MIVRKSLIAFLLCAVALTFPVCRSGEDNEGAIGREPDQPGEQGESSERDAAEQAGEVAPNTLTEEESAQGWRLLFDGETFAGWRGLGRDSIPEGVAGSRPDFEK